MGGTKTFEQLKEGSAWVEKRRQKLEAKQKKMRAKKHISAKRAQARVAQEATKVSKSVKKDPVKFQKAANTMLEADHALSLFRVQALEQEKAAAWKQKQQQSLLASSL